MGQVRDDIVPDSMNVRPEIQLTSVLQRQHSVDGRLLPSVETTEAPAAPVPESLLSNSPCCSHVRPLATVLPALNVCVFLESLLKCWNIFLSVMWARCSLR